MEISIELILGIIGSVTGVTSLLIQILKYKKESPRIEAKLTKSKHHYQEDAQSKTGYRLIFVIDLLVTNKGDRATTIYNAILDFKIGQKETQITSIELNQRVDSSDTKQIRPSLSLSSSYGRLSKKERTIHTESLSH